MELIIIVLYVMVAIGFFLVALRWCHQENELDHIGVVVSLLVAIFWPVIVGIFVAKDYSNRPF